MYVTVGIAPEGGELCEDSSADNGIDLYKGVNLQSIHEIDVYSWKVPLLGEGGIFLESIKRQCLWRYNTLILEMTVAAGLS
jgi:hypothetical protein